MRAALGLGANRGDATMHVRRAIEQLRRRTRVVAVSPLVTTAPEAGASVGRYCNAAVVVETPLSPVGLLALTQALEERVGRLPATARGARWWPRPLDIDLLLCDERTVRTAVLCVPHPRLAQRAFVLGPLAAIAADWPVPGTRATVGELLARV